MEEKSTGTLLANIGSQCSPSISFKRTLMMNIANEFLARYIYTFLGMTQRPFTTSSCLSFHELNDPCIAELQKLLKA
jgi:hypothetical protein